MLKNATYNFASQESFHVVLILDWHGSIFRDSFLLYFGRADSSMRTSSYTFFVPFALVAIIIFGYSPSLLAQTKTHKQFNLSKNYSPDFFDKENKTAISFGGRIVNETQYNSFNWQGQLNPKLNSRFYIYPEISIGAIPLTGRINLSTESTQYQYPSYNRFSFGFDNRRFQSQLKKDLEKRVQERLASSEFIHSTVRQIEDSLMTYKQIANQIEKPDYKKNLRVAEGLLSDTAKMDSFNLSQNKFQIQKAKGILSSHKEKMRMVKYIDELEHRLKEAKVKYPSKYPNADSLKAIEMKSLPSIYTYATKIRDLQFGICYPNLSPLTMNGLPLNGGYTSFKLGNIVAGAGVGSTSQRRLNFSLREKPSFGNSRIFLTNVGYDNDRESIVLNVLKTQEGYSNRTTWEAEPITNAVLSLQAKKKFKSGSVQAELGRSATIVEGLKGLPQQPKSINKTLADNRERTNHALRAEGSYTINATNTTIQTGARYIGEDFSSAGTPYLRSGITAINAGIKQYLFKNFVFASAEAGREQFNENKSIKASNHWTTVMLQAGMTFPRFPSITIGYMPTKQYYEYMESDSGIYSTLNMKFLQASHVLYFGEVPLTISAFYSDAKSYTLNYEFLNKNMMCELTMPVGIYYLVRANYTRSTATYLDRPVPYTHFFVDATKTINQKSFGLGAQYRESDMLKIKSLFTTLGSSNLFKNITSTFRLELMNVTHLVNERADKESLEVGCALLITYSL